MTNEKRNQIIEQIRKLQEIANPDSGAFQGEISNASAMMQKLMDKYSISQMEIDASRNDEIDKAFESKTSDTVLFSILHWHWKLARVVARITHTRHYSTSRYSSTPVRKTSALAEEFPNDKRSYRSGEYNSISFFGDPKNVEIACELYLEFLFKIDRMSAIATDEYSKYQYKKINFEHPRVYRNSWREGCIDAINKKVREQEETRSEDTSNSIVLYTKQVDKAYNDFSQNFTKLNSSGGGSSFSSAGYSSGKEAGSNMSLTPTKKIEVKSNLLKG